MLIIVFIGLIITVNKKGENMNLLNEKIRVITHTLAKYKKMEALTPNDRERQRIRKNIKELNTLLDDLLVQAGDG